MRDDVALAACPVDVVGSRARERIEEQQLPEGAYIDGQRQRARAGKLVQIRAELPRAVGIELGKHQGVFLSDNRLQIVSDVHEREEKMREESVTITAQRSTKITGVATQMEHGF